MDVNTIKIIDFESTPPEALVSWEAETGVDNPLYHVYVDGKFYDTTTGTKIIVQFQDTGRHWVEIMIGGPGSTEEDLSAFVSTIPGGRVKLSWTASASADVDHYDIYYDSGLGGGLSYLDRTKADETEWVSDEFDDGTYVFRVDAVDTAGNRRTSGSTKTVTIAKYPAAPSDLTLESFNGTTNMASFSFAESPTAGVTGYKIYHNSGSGNINYGTIITSVLAGNTTFSIACPTTGTWKVGIRAYTAAYTEDNVDVTEEFELTGSPLEQGEGKPNTPEGLVGVPGAAGIIDLYCTYDAYEEKTKGTQVNFYADDGAGGDIDYSSTVATATIDDHETGEMFTADILATTAALTDGSTYTFVAKTATAAGTESDASDTCDATADATAPDDITALAGEAVNYEE